MKNLNKVVLASAIASAMICGSAFSEEQTSIIEAFKDSKASLSFRLRVEDVTQDGVEDSLATTLRTRLNFTTGIYNGLSGFVEFDQVSELIEVDYNTGAGDAAFPNTATIADPEGTDLNQAFIQYKTDGTTVKYGRQRILLDNQRFVGGVGWRQNEQTYDAFSVSNTSVDNLNLFGAYVFNVNRIFGDDRTPAGDNTSSTFLLNANYTIADIGSVTGYGYLIDNQDITKYSSDTFGVRFAGKSNALAYSAEYATQSSAYDNPADYTASYTDLEGSYSFKPAKVTLGYQVLGADGANGQFSTPLATLHKFQGWDDKFLGGGQGNIVGGIQDLHASVGGKFGKVNAAVVYHTFSSDDSAVSGMDTLGSELGLVVKGKVGPLGLLFKVSDYSADDFGTDTTKVWLMASTNI